MCRASVCLLCFSFFSFHFDLATIEKLFILHSNALVKVLSCHLRSVSRNKSVRHACHNGHAIVPLSFSVSLAPLCGSLQRNGQLETQFKSSAYAKCHVISITQHGKRIEESKGEREREGVMERTEKEGKIKRKTLAQFIN